MALTPSSNTEQVEILHPTPTWVPPTPTCPSTPAPQRRLCGRGLWEHNVATRGRRRIGGVSPWDAVKGRGQYLQRQPLGDRQGWSSSNSASNNTTTTTTTTTRRRSLVIIRRAPPPPPPPPPPTTTTTTTTTKATAAAAATATATATATAANVFPASYLLCQLK